MLAQSLGPGRERMSNVKSFSSQDLFMLKRKGKGHHNQEYSDPTKKASALAAGPRTWMSLEAAVMWKPGQSAVGTLK